MLSRQGGRKEVNIVKTRRHKANFVKYKPASQLSTDQGRKIEDNFQGQDQCGKREDNFPRSRLENGRQLSKRSRTDAEIRV